MKTPRNTIQTVIKGLLAVVIIFSDYLPLVFTAYFALLFTFLETFNFISGKEAKKEIGYNSDNNQIVTQKDNATETPALVVSVVMQLLSLAAVFLLTWYMLEKKLKYFN